MSEMLIVMKGNEHVEVLRDWQVDERWQRNDNERPKSVLQSMKSDRVEKPVLRRTT